ncbi:MAG: DUF6056 family protein [Clostridia bacterium]|nr:DUF6056 family protein [Clostridia bacterium]
MMFFGNHSGGKVRLTYPSTGESQIIDTYLDNEDWVEVMVDIALDGKGSLNRMRLALFVGILGCVAASAALCIALYRFMRKRRKAARAFAQKLARVWPGRAPLNPRAWRRGTFALCAISILPLLLIAVYVRPVWDDYRFSIATRHAWQQTGSLWATLHAAVNVAIEFYIEWQGSFSSTFVMSLQPAIFGEHWYALTPYVLLGSLVLGTWLFVRTMVGKRYGGVLCWLALFFFLQFVPGVEQAFFWYNGGAYYTFFYGLSLILYSFVLRAHRADKPEKRVAYMIGTCLLAAFVGGGNYVTALLSSVLLALLTSYRAIQRDRRLWIPLAAFLCLMGTFVVSAVAPGNAVRQSQSDGMPYVAAVIASFPQALRYLMGSMRVEFLLGALIALPFLYQAAEHSGHAFRYPALVSLLSLCVYACQVTPHLAALSTIGPARLTALLFYTNFLLIGGNMFYWSGWFAKKGGVVVSLRILARWIAVGAAVLLVLACATTVVRESHTINGASAARSLLDGSAQRFGQEMDARAKIYEDEAIRDAVVLPVSVRPRVFHGGDIAWDSTQWENEIVAEFYGKDSVRLGQ